MATQSERWQAYLAALNTPFIKRARLRFLNNDGSLAFALDNNPNKGSNRSAAFLQEGTLNVNLQNGMRRQASVTLSNLDGEFDYNVNKRWFGELVALDEGLVLPDGTDFYLPQGVFAIKDPEFTENPGERTANYNLVDKWANFNGDLYGNLDGIYEVPVNSDIFGAMASILQFDRGNGILYDSTPPIFTNYYNDKYTTLPDGSVVSFLLSPYTYRCDSTSGTYADVLLELAGMFAAWIGYDQTGALRVDPSQDDILDTNKPVLWEFNPTTQQYLGRTYQVSNSQVYNDIIVRGESLSDYGAVGGRATNYDPSSDTNANLIGLKTLQMDGAGYYTQTVCEDYASFMLKRKTILQKSVSFRSSQIFHIVENNLVTFRDPTKSSGNLERCLINGFSRPIAQNGEMTINATSVIDFPIATITTYPKPTYDQIVDTSVYIDTATGHLIWRTPLAYRYGSTLGINNQRHLLQSYSATFDPATMQINSTGHLLAQNE